MRPALARTGKYEDAVPLLLHAANHGPRHWTKVCYANAAFCLLEEGNLGPAMVLLGVVMAEINYELHGRPLENLTADLPGKGIWVNERSIIGEKLVVGSATGRSQRAGIRTAIKHS